MSESQQFMVPPPATSLHAATDSATAADGVLFSRNFILLWLGQLISSIGDRFTTAALIYFVFKGDEVGKYTAQFGFAGMLPGLLFAPLYGWIIDSFERKRIMIAADLIRVIVVMSFIYVLAGPKPDYTLGCLALFALGTFNGLFIPARQASLPQIVPPTRLLSANSLIALLGPVGTLVGTPLAIVIITYMGTWNAYLINALCFVVSAICIQAISKKLWPDKQEHPEGHQPLKKTWSELADGTKTLRALPDLIPLVIINGIFAFASLMFLVVVMEHAKKNLDVQVVQNFLDPILATVGSKSLQHNTYQMVAVGSLFGALGAGMGLGIFFCGLSPRAVHWNGLPYAGLAGLGLGFLVFANLTNIALILPFALLLGAAATVVPIPIEARIQNDVDNHHRGRLFALRNMWTTLCGLLALGMNIDGRLLHYFGAAHMITGLGAAILIATLVLVVQKLSVLRTFWSVRPQ